MKRPLLLLLVNIFLQVHLIGQTPTIQDCLGAIPICNRIYSETFVPSGGGNYPDEINPATVCGFPEEGSVWYTFKVNKSGDFGFLITPDQLSDDYDWALFNITNANCEDIFNNASLLVSCNAAAIYTQNGVLIDCAGRTGATGATTLDRQRGGCYGGTDQNGFPLAISTFNALINVQRNNTYALMVSNFTKSGRGYTIDFGLTDVGIIDNEAPEISHIDFPEKCQDNQITLHFNENIQLNTIPSSDNFLLIGPDGVEYDVSVQASSFRNFSNQVTLVIEKGLIDDGTYNFVLTANGTTHFLDNCDNPFSRGEFASDFELRSPGLPEVQLGIDTIICNPITLNASNKEASYQWQDGSTSAQLLVTQTGIYSVTINNSCGMTTDELSITLYELPNIDFGEDTLLCPTAELRLDATADIASYQWQDNSQNSSFTITQPGNYQVTVTNLCGVDIEEIQVSYREPLAINLGADTIICDGRPLSLTAYNENAAYLWQDGSNDEIFVANETGEYAVTVSNVCNSISNSRSIILLEGPPIIEFGEDQRLCPAEEKVLDASNQEATYSWQDGSTEANFTVTQLGLYEVTVTNACGTTRDDIAIDYLLPLDVNLQEDLFLCQPTALLSTNDHPDATYRWNNGIEKRALIVAEPGFYILEAETICEVKRDTVNVMACERCKLYIPTAFSPNNDGINDVFIPFTEADCVLNNFQLQIFDRWGNQIFESNNPTIGWDGKYKNQSVTSIIIKQKKLIKY